MSDLHLQASQAETAAAFGRYLQQGGFDGLFLLGDLFEIWTGDDVLADAQPHPEHDFIRHIAGALKQASMRAPLYLMHGNRDFLIGQAFAEATGCALLLDPTVLDWGPHRSLLSHGDAWCLADTAYLQFRETVRHPGWQRQFLSRPLAERATIANHLREQSEQRKRETVASGEAFADVDHALAVQWLRQSHCQRLIHGHTHRPGCHDLGDGLQRVVLSDWDACAHPPRLEVVSLHLDGDLKRWPLRP